MAGYSLGGYGRRLASRSRNDAYYAALQHSVPAGGIVLDVGTGAGVLARLADLAERYGG